MKDEYNKSYQEKDYEKLPDLSEQTTKKSRSVLKVVLICLSVLLVVSFVYDNIVKPYIEKKKEEIEKIISISSDDDDESVDDEDDITSIEDDDDDYDIIDVKPTSTKPVTSGKVDANPSSTPSQPVVEPIEVNAESPLPSQPQTIMDNSPKHIRANSEDNSGLSTMELLEKRTHDRAVKRAKEQGVSTEGSTMEILERISHAKAVKRAQSEGVSTKGSTTEILERISHAKAVKRAKEAGVSTEGSTIDILERISRKNLEKMGY